MTTATASPPPRTNPYVEQSAADLAIDPRPGPLAWPGVADRLADYVELIKPRISVMVLVTVVVGYTLASHGDWQWRVLLPCLLGVGLLATASNSWNQWLERRTDARMDRTADRPLPAGRLSGAEVVTFGLLCAVAGTLTLAAFVNLTTALLTFSTLALYVGAYTPLKRYTSLCTAVGAIPGALPPVLGWTAAGGALDEGALALFAVLFLWQFPHFLAIAWLYRDQYENAGLKMLPRTRSTRVVGLLGVTYALVLIPVSLMPRSVSLAGDLYVVAAILLGLMYLAGAIRFAAGQSRESARGLILVSLIYLPTLLLILTFDHLRLLT